MLSGAMKTTKKNNVKEKIKNKCASNLLRHKLAEGRMVTPLQRKTDAIIRYEATFIVVTVPCTSYVPL